MWRGGGPCPQEALNPQTLQPGEAGDSRFSPEARTIDHKDLGFRV